MKGFQLKQITLHKMCLASLLCGPWVDLCSLYELYCKRFLSIYEVAQARNMSIGEQSALLRNIRNSGCLPFTTNSRKFRLGCKW